jgi:hypothetical protein
MPAIQWALDNGSTWLDWQCSKLEPLCYHCIGTNEMYIHAEHNDDACWDEMCEKALAAEVFAWAHENGCPCTCGQDAVVDDREGYRYLSEL